MAEEEEDGPHEAQPCKPAFRLVVHPRCVRTRNRLPDCSPCCPQGRAGVLGQVVNRGWGRQVQISEDRENAIHRGRMALTSDVQHVVPRDVSAHGSVVTLERSRPWHPWGSLTSLLLAAPPRASRATRGGSHASLARSVAWAGGLRVAAATNRAAHGAPIAATVRNSEGSLALLAEPYALRFTRRSVVVVAVHRRSNARKWWLRQAGPVTANMMEASPTRFASVGA